MNNRGSNRATILLLEAPWTPALSSEDGYRPEVSVQSYVEAFAANNGYRLIYRQVFDADALRYWLRAMKNQKLGDRLVWITGHGQEDEDGRVGLWVPNLGARTKETRTEGTIIPADVIGRAMRRERAGAINGVVIDACKFGCNNMRSDWLAEQDAWVLTYRKSIDWTTALGFDLKALEWMYDEHPKYPESSSEAARRFESGVETGGYKSTKDRVVLEGWARALGARLHYRRNGQWDSVDYGARPSS